MTPEQYDFMDKLRYFGCSATVWDLGPQTTQAENTARQFCKRHGWVVFDRKTRCWQMTDEGRWMLREISAALTTGKSGERDA